MGDDDNDDGHHSALTCRADDSFSRARSYLWPQSSCSAGLCPSIVCSLTGTEPFHGTATKQAPAELIGRSELLSSVLFQLPLILPSVHPNAPNNTRQAMFIVAKPRVRLRAFIGFIRKQHISSNV